MQAVAGSVEKHIRNRVGGAWVMRPVDKHLKGIRAMYVVFLGFVNIMMLVCIAQGLHFLPILITFFYCFWWVGTKQSSDAPCSLCPAGSYSSVTGQPSKMGRDCFCFPARKVDSEPFYH